VSEPRPSTPPPATTPKNLSLSVGFGILCFITALYLGRDIAIPFALAMLLAFALAPIVDLLRRIRVPKLGSVIVAVSLAFSLIGIVGYVFGSQLIQLADSLPSYQTTIQEKLRSLRDSASGSGIVSRVTGTLRDLGKELSAPAQPALDAAPSSGAVTQRTPVPVIIEPPPMQSFQMIGAVLGQLVFPLMQAGIVIVFVIVMLLERDDLRDRFIKLTGAGDLHKSTEALTEAGTRVSRYLLMQLLLNTGYGIAIGVGLYFIGVPNAVLWGLLATVMKFIPYLGTFLSAVFPVVLAFGIDPTWAMLAWTVALFVTVEAISNNLVEPWVYGATTGLSPLAIIIAAIFWTILWGPVGLILATPLTVCLLVIGRYVPQLNFLDVLLGSEPVLAPEQRFYQRLLSGNVEEAVDLAERYVAERSLSAFYGEVVIPTLRLAQNDRQRMTTDIGYRRIVADGLAVVLREVVEEAKDGKQTGPEITDQQLPAGAAESVLSIGGRTELDQSAAEMVARALGERGIRARVLSPVSVGQDVIGQLDLTGIEVICLSYLDPTPYVFAKFVSRRLKRRQPQMRILICAWNPASPETPSDDPTVRGVADAISVSMEDTVRLVEGWLESDVSKGMDAPGLPENELDRLNALKELRLSAAGETQFDTLAGKVAEAFDVPIALVSLVDAENQFWPGAAGLPGDVDAARKGPRDLSICTHVVAGGQMIVVEDVARDPRFASNPFLLEKGIRFYAGAPLRTASGFVLGSLCVIDSKPRQFPKKEQKLLQVIADELMAQIEADCRRSEVVLKESQAQDPASKSNIDIKTASA
jgi:predicted PurR-regulated permease PerM